MLPNPKSHGLGESGGVQHRSVDVVGYAPWLPNELAQ